MIFNLLHQPYWLDYNHLYVFGKSLHQQEYKILRKGLDAGLTKQQIPNLFSSHEALRTANSYFLTAIERFSGVRNGKIRADFYDDGQVIPDPSALDHTQTDLLLFLFIFIYACLSRDDNNPSRVNSFRSTTWTGQTFTTYTTLNTEQKHLPIKVSADN